MLTISEALTAGIEHSKCGEAHRHNLELLGRLVNNYAATHWPVEQFRDLQVFHILQLIRDMERQGRSPRYIKHIINTIRLASNYASDYLGMEPLKIEKRHIPVPLEAPKIWLTYRQIAQACEVARDAEPRRNVTDPRSRPRPLELARLILMTCGICGLRLTEFGQLTADCLDAADNLTITDDECTGKTIKNDSSRRVIPIPGIVADALRDYWGRYGQWSKSRHSNSERVANLFKAAFDATEDDLYMITPPKNLRKTFTNELKGVVDDKFLVAYGGWAFTGTMLRDYMALRPRPDDPPQIKQRSIEGLRDAVVDAMEKKCTDLHF